MKRIEPLVSVIVPSYNHELYVEETILSIVNQTYKNVELIVIDDGSVDDSVKIIESLSEKYQFKFISQENIGVSGTLNRGIELSKGEYVCTCESDDKFHLNKIKEQIEFMHTNQQYGIVYTDRIKFYENGFIRKLPGNNNGSGNLFDRLLCQEIRVPPGTIMYKRSVFDSVGLFDINLAVEDFDMILRIANKYQIGYLRKYLFYYRSHSGNTVNNVDKMKLNSDIIIDKWIDKDSYSKAVTRNKLLYFRAYSSLEKVKAMRMLPASLMIFKEKVFYEGVLRLLFPKRLYKRVLKR